MTRVLRMAVMNYDRLFSRIRAAIAVMGANSDVRNELHARIVCAEGASEELFFLAWFAARISLEEWSDNLKGVSHVA